MLGRHQSFSLFSFRLLSPEFFDISFRSLMFHGSSWSCEFLTGFMAMETVDTIVLLKSFE
jgi:hypothetical protein